MNQTIIITKPDQRLLKQLKILCNKVNSNTLTCFVFKNKILTIQEKT